MDMVSAMITTHGQLWRSDIIGLLADLGAYC